MFVYEKVVSCISPLLFNFPLGYTIRKIQENKNKLELNGAHQLWSVAMTLLGENVNITKKTKHMFMYGHQTTGQNHCAIVDNTSCESVAALNYFGAMVTD